VSTHGTWNLTLALGAKPSFVSLTMIKSITISLAENSLEHNHAIMIAHNYLGFITPSNQ
jgi:hypothetical protein